MKKQKDEKIFYLTCEGFAKLLANRCPLENRDKIIASLVIAYITTSRNGSSQVNKKLRACLNTFMHLFKRIDLVALVGSFLPTLKFLIAKHASMDVQRELGKLFYFLTADSKNQRPTLMNNLAREILENADDYMYIQRLIEILIEFRVHQCDVVEFDFDSVDLLRRLHDQMQLIMASFSCWNDSSSN